MHKISFQTCRAHSCGICLPGSSPKQKSAQYTPYFEIIMYFIKGYLEAGLGLSVQDPSDLVLQSCGHHVLLSQPAMMGWLFGNCYISKGIGIID